MKMTVGQNEDQNNISQTEDRSKPRWIKMKVDQNEDGSNEDRSKLWQIKMKVDCSEGRSKEIGQTKERSK